MGIYGAIFGDICGSRFEFMGQPKDDFELLHEDCKITDDSMMTIAVANACLKYKNNPELNFQNTVIGEMQSLGRKFPDVGYGHGFMKWIGSSNPEPYNSWGNGSAMRTSGVPVVFHDMEEKDMLKKAEEVSSVTHNHPEGIKGAVIVSKIIWMGNHGITLNTIKKYAEKEYGFSFDEWNFERIRDNRDEWYKECIGKENTHVQIMRSMGIYFDVSCQGTVPLALSALFSGKDFIDVVRKSILFWGDTDTTAAIAGSMAEAFYPIPQEIKEYTNKEIRNYSPELLEIIEKTNEYLK